jgi:cell wall-associated NlpC family hydrolase
MVIFKEVFLMNLERLGISDLNRRTGSELSELTRNGGQKHSEILKKLKKRTGTGNFRNIRDMVSLSDEAREEVLRERQTTNNSNNNTQTRSQSNNQSDTQVNGQINGREVSGDEVKGILSKVFDKIKSVLPNQASQVSEIFDKIIDSLSGLGRGTGNNTTQTSTTNTNTNTNTNTDTTPTPAPPAPTTPAATAPAPTTTQQATETAPQGSSDAVKKILNKAYEWEGKHYRKGVELQCSEWVSEVVAESGGAPEGFKTVTAAKQLDKYGHDVPRDQLQPGDLVFIRQGNDDFSHVGIYVGDGKYIHRPNGRTEVKVGSVGNNVSKGKRIV